MTLLESWAKENPFAAKMSGADVAIAQHQALRAQLATLAPPPAPELAPEMQERIEEADAKLRSLTIRRGATASKPA